MLRAPTSDGPADPDAGAKILPHVVLTEVIKLV
jgi:hypothetical protein